MNRKKKREDKILSKRLNPLLKKDLEQGWEDSSNEQYDGNKKLLYRKGRLNKKQKTAAAAVQDNCAGSHQAIETSIPATDYDN